MEKRCDLFIIGAGTGGYVLALKAAQKGLKVILAEKESVGGTCLNRGCIPTKIYAHAAHYTEEAKTIKRKGITASVSVDMSVLKKYKDRTVNRLVKGIEMLCNKRGVEIIKGIVKYDNGFYIGEDKIIAKDTVIATGSSPKTIPSLPFDGEFVVSSNEILNMEEIPNSLLIVGAGVIGLEFASIFASFGTKVYVVEILDTILPGIADKETKDILLSKLKRMGIKFFLGNGLDKIDKENKKAILSSSEEISVDKILVSIGRNLNGNSIEGIENTGIKIDRGMIYVNEYLETGVEHIYAAGDVVGGPLLAHKASYDGDIILHNILNEDKKKRDYLRIPSAVFTAAELATAGYMPDYMDKQGIEYITGTFPYAASGRASGEEERGGLVKVFADKNTQKVLGGIIVGKHADMLIQEISLAIYNNLTLEDISKTVHIHPTYNEMIHESVEDALGFPLHKE